MGTSIFSLTRGVVRLLAALAAVLGCWLATLVLPAAASALSWSGPYPVDTHAHGQALDRVACPTSTQCTAIDAHGQAVTFNPQAPQTETTVTISSQTVIGLSCPLATQCTAVDLSGNEITFNPQSSASVTPTPIDSNGIPLGLTCPSASLCTSVDDNGQAVTFDPQSGHAIASGAIDSSRVLVAVSCPGSSTTQCAAVDSSGGAVMFDPGAPTAQSPVAVNTNSSSPSGLACRPTLCVVVDDAGYAETFSFQSGTPQQKSSGPIDVTSAGATALSDVSCPTDGECVAVDVRGNESSFDPSLLFTAPIPIDSGQALADVACPSATQCTAVDRAGQEVTFDPTSPGSPRPVPIDGHTNLSGLSCPSSTQCTAIDVSGSEATFAPGSSSASGVATVDPGISALYGIACPTGTQCTAVDNQGQEVTFNPQAPGGPTPSGVDAGHALFAVACPSVSQCTAVDDGGREVTFNPANPSAAKPSAVDSRHSLLALACPSSSQCTAMDDRGAEVTFDPAVPGSPVAYAVDQVAAVAVTCPTTSQCTAVDGSGDELTFDPLTPGQGSAEVIDKTPLAAVACRTTTGCVAVDQSGRVLEGDPHGTEAWSAQPVSGNALVDVACPSARECVAVDQPGDAFVGASGPLPPVPGAIRAPRIHGTKKQGYTLTAESGSWSNAPTSFRYQWLRCNRSGRHCKAIAAAQGPSYRLATADISHRIRVQEQAWNITGAGPPQTSSATARVRPLVYLASWRGSLSGVAKGRPILTLRLAMAVGEAPLRSVSIDLPRGVTLSASPTLIRIFGTFGRLRFGVRRSAHQLRIICRSRTSGLGVTITSGLRASQTLSRKVRAHRVRSVKLVVTLEERGGSAAQVILRLPVR